MAFTEITKGTAFTEITGISSKDLATNDEKANIINEMGELLAKYTKTLEHTQKSERDTRNSGQDR